MAGVTGIVATRGDVDLLPVFSTWPEDWEVLSWDNGKGLITRWFKNDGNDHGEQYEPFWQRDMSVQQMPVDDLGPYARFAAIEWATHDIIFVMDDDVIVSDPQAIVDEWHRANVEDLAEKFSQLQPGDTIEATDETFVVCNLPSEFRPHYPDSAMLGFGGAFHRDAPERAFTRFFDHHRNMRPTDTVFKRESCRIFTTLTSRILVDVPKTDMPYASDPNRLWKDPKHVWYRGEALRLAREVRDAG